jgi:hypothetical protein
MNNIELQNSLNKEIKDILVYSFLTFVIVRFVKFIYIYIHNLFENYKWPYIQLIFGTIELNLNILLSVLILSPIFETIFLYLFFYKKFFNTKYQISIFATLFGFYHFLSLGLYGFWYSFFIGIIFAYQYQKNNISLGRDIAFRRSLLTHVLYNVISVQI